jgi:hypothetical protein
MSEAPLILALDVASQMGVAEGRVGQVPRSYTVNLGDRDCTMAERAGKATRWIAERLMVDRPDWIYIEAPLNPTASRDANSTIVALTLFGALAGPAQCKLRNVGQANVQTVRSAFLGHGRPKMPKERAKAMCKALGWDPKNTDEADALAVWWWAGMKHAPRLYTPITPMLQAKINSPFDTDLKAKGARHVG